MYMVVEVPTTGNWIPCGRPTVLAKLSATVATLKRKQKVHEEKIEKTKEIDILRDRKNGLYGHIKAVEADKKKSKEALIQLERDGGFDNDVEIVHLNMAIAEAEGDSTKSRKEIQELEKEIAELKRGGKAPCKRRRAVQGRRYENYQYLLFLMSSRS